MKEIWNSIQMAFTAIGGFFGWFLGGVDGFLHVLLVFVVIDYITGVMCAIYDHDLSSEIGFKGISQVCAEDCDHLLLYFQRRNLHSGKRSSPRPSGTGKAEAGSCAPSQKFGIREKRGQER